MRVCTGCSYRRLVSVLSKSSDLNHLRFLETGKSIDGYVPYDMGIGGGDYIKLTYCLNCGQIQGNFPVEVQEQEEEMEDNE